MNQDTLSRWLPILRLLYAAQNTTPGKLAAHFGTSPASMFSTIRNMREAGLLKRAKRGFAGYYLTEKAKKLLAN